MPDVLPYELNVWVGDSLGKFGRTSEKNVIFYVQSENFPSSEVMQYFNSLVEPLGLTATAVHTWYSQHLARIGIYNQGVLIRDRNSLTMTGAPIDIELPPVLTASYMRSRLPQTIPFQQTIWFTGSCMHPEKGWSGKDADIIVFGEEDRKKQVEIKYYFENLLGWRVDVGAAVMANREPVYICKTYEGGELCLP
jgi:hypothetical protein